MAFAGDYIVLGAKGKNMQRSIFSLFVSDLLWSCSRQRQGIQAGAILPTLEPPGLVLAPLAYPLVPIPGAQEAAAVPWWRLLLVHLFVWVGGRGSRLCRLLRLVPRSHRQGCHPREDHLAAVRGRPSTSHPALQAEPAALPVTSPAGQVRAAPLSVIPAGPSAVGPLLTAAEGHQKELQVQGQCAGASAGRSLQGGTELAGGLCVLRTPRGRGCGWTTWTARDSWTTL